MAKFDVKKMVSRWLLPVAALSMVVVTQGCYWGASYYPQTYTYCYYDYWGYYVCEYNYYNGDGSTDQGKDIVASASNAEEAALFSAARHYATKFSLSDEQGMKVARTLRDFSAVQERSEQDIADFAQRLYGVDPTRIASAVAKAQAGNHAELNAVVGEAAQRFETTTENMKEMIKTLHGKALTDQGIQL